MREQFGWRGRATGGGLDPSNEQFKEKNELTRDFVGGNRENELGGRINDTMGGKSAIRTR